MRSQWFLCNLCGDRGRSATPNSRRKKYSVRARRELAELEVCSGCLGRLQAIQNTEKADRSLREILAGLRRNESV